MTRLFRLSFALASLLIAVQLVFGQASNAVMPSVSRSHEGSKGYGRSVSVAEKTKPANETKSVPDSDNPVISDPLVRVLIAKGILTEVEGRSISASGTPVEQRDRLASLLRDKGLISAAEYEAVRTVAPAEDAARALATASSSERVAAQKS